MKRLLTAFVTMLAIFFPCRVVSQEASGESVEPLRPVTASYMLEMGSVKMADTYLSPVYYTGSTLGFAYERMQAMKFSPDKWVMQLTGRLDLGYGENHAKNAETWRINAEVRWGMMRRWREVFTPGLTLGVGGATAIEGGCLYNARNSNNPASAKLAWTIDATAYAAYNFRIKRLPITLRYQATLPVIGAFFSPEYDELYYEIYLGNDSGLVHCAWLGSRFAMTNLLTADLRFGSTNLRIGYRAYRLSSKVNDIVTNITTHTFVLGLAGEWLSLPQRHSLSRDARIISALY